MADKEDCEQIDIALATYNGAKYLRAQVESLISQTYPNLRIIVGDDYSSDNTVEAIEELKTRYPDKIEVHAFKQNVGLSQNFSRLLELTEADYVMFCDQDDVWLPEKVEKSYDKLKSLEKQWGKDVPLLVHTDMQVVDDHLNVLAPSQWKRQHLNIKKSGNLNSVLMQNAAWGCTMLFNRKLIDLATPIPIESFVHDFWLALIAAGCGKMDYVNETTMLYRQHGSNWVGSKAGNYKWFIEDAVKNPEYQKQTELRIMRGMVRAYVFYKRYHSFLNEKQRRMVEDFIELKYQPLWRELGLRTRYGFFYHGFWPSIAFLLATIRMGRADPKYRQKL